ncbi:lytic polysaccharide monooxygenase [Diplodia corticola]|uniref:Lytic polysaccharide monooxygenase n=1 Tax=Diplodia corticola TaxID=236234 RepID=A0A1J9RZH9_9PEZI|nr:lytic polysaccharide monooxygenase [Diplodia corticola]OJD33196.1 lytic polysaccharide monooxygenase [Diplodia corticola]
MRLHTFPWVLLGLAASPPPVRAHMSLRQPVPYDAETLRGDRSPLSNNYPCHTSNFAWTGSVPEMAVGESQPLVFYPQAGEDGIAQPAVHDGGTCQLSVSLDVPPTAESVFKVIKTIEGGCPGVDFTPHNFTYEIPPAVPSGKAVFAWTWFPVSSGAAEMYMNCAPIAVSGGAQAGDTAAFDALPDMLVANYSPVDCARDAAAPQAVMKAVNPGAVLEHGPKPAASVFPTATPVGNQCPTAADSAAASQTLAASADAGGGAFVEASASASTSAAATTLLTSTASAAAVQTGEPSSAPQGSVDTPVAATAAADPAAATPATPATAATAATASAASDKACDSVEDGQLVCNGTDRFGICNWGAVAVWQSVAAGTVCENGTVKAVDKKKKMAVRGAEEAKAKRHLHFHGRYSAGRRHVHG